MKSAKKSSSESLWVVEMFNDEMNRFEPTVGASLSRENGRFDLAVWKRMNVGRFRLARYVREKP